MLGRIAARGGTGAAGEQAQPEGVGPAQRIAMKTVTPNEHARLPVPLPDTEDSNFAPIRRARKPSSEAGGWESGRTHCFLATRCQPYFPPSTGSRRMQKEDSP